LTQSLFHLFICLTREIISSFHLGHHISSFYFIFSSFHLLLTFKESRILRNMKSIFARSLSKSYDGINAVDGIDLDVNEGQIFGFLGPNGAGKSTVIKLLTTLIQPTSGKISVLGIDTVKEPLSIRKKIGVVLQQPSYEPTLSVEKSLEKYGMKQVGRDNVVNLYQKSKKDGGNYTFGNGNAIYACDIGVGNCTDYHSYFMSLDRTIGIPSRFHMGFLIPPGEEGIVDGYHCWADYHVEGEGWYPVDISEADKDPNRKDYYFGTVDNNRVEMMLGRDFILKGYESEIANLFIYPIMEVNDKKSSAFTKSFSYNNLSH